MACPHLPQNRSYGLASVPQPAQAMGFFSVSTTRFPSTRRSTSGAPTSCAFMDSAAWRPPGRGNSIGGLSRELCTSLPLTEMTFLPNEPSFALTVVASSISQVLSMAPPRSCHPRAGGGPAILVHLGPRALDHLLPLRLLALDPRQERLRPAAVGL